MSYMLDTNTCAFITRKDQAVLEAVKAHRGDGLFISAITLSEIEFGISNSTNSGKYREALLKLLTILTVLPYDDAAAIAYGELRADLKSAAA
jgi:tRNA(fMet)-specific endonuclease VapC